MTEGQPLPAVSDAIKAAEDDHADFVQVFLRQGLRYPAALVVGGGGERWRISLSGNDEADSYFLKMAAALTFARVVVATSAEDGAVRTWAMVPTPEAPGAPARLIELRSIISDGEAGVVERRFAGCECWSAYRPTDDEILKFDQVIDRPPFVITARPEGLAAAALFRRH